MDFYPFLCFLVYLTVPWHVSRCRVINAETLLSEAQGNTEELSTEQTTEDHNQTPNSTTDDGMAIRQAARMWNRARLIAGLSGESGDEVSEEEIEEARRQSIKRMRLQQIRSHILQELGLSEPPSQRGPNLNPGIIFNYTTNRSDPQNSDSQEPYSSQRFHCIPASCDEPEYNTSQTRTGPNQKSMELYFNIPSYPERNSELTHSLLKLRLKDEGDCQCHHRRRGSDVHDSRLEVRVYQYMRGLKPNGRPRKRLMDAKMVSPTEERWVILNIRTAVRYWMRDAETNYGLEVVVRNTVEQRLDANGVFVGLNCSINETNICLPANTVDEALGVPQRILTDYENSLAPHLQLVSVETRDEPTSRGKRQAIHKPYCVKESTFISFKEIGWDGVISPEGLVCSKCRCLPNLLKGINRSKECDDCVPTKTKSLSIRYYDDQGNVAVSVLENFVIQECG